MDIHSYIEKHADKKNAENLQRFFKTGKGEYGEGDIFLGIKVPIQRKIVKEFKDLEINKIQNLLDSKIHEKRFIGLLILIEQFKKANEENKKNIFDLYLKNTKNINNWDLVDLSAPNIVGNFLLDKNKDILYQLANSNDLWEKRISIISTFSFIRKNEFEDSLELTKLLFNDRHDLIHKAVGWMLREIGKKDINVLESFLKEDSRYKQMPRTMLRYAIEKFDEEKRKKYLRGNI
ncbi:MAG: DNA alkylation repair protein [Candidatus Pacearchaeota archaeon]